LASGNEARHFEVKSDTVINVNAAAAPVTPAPTYTSLPGIDAPFIECDGPANVTAELNETGTEDFTITTSSALLTLAASLDYEVNDRYVVIMTVVDAVASPQRTGTIVVRVQVSDVNDNCPIMNSTGHVFEPVPALEVDPIIFMNASDADSGINAELLYTASTPQVE
jgi:syndecan 4